MKKYRIYFTQLNNGTKDIEAKNKKEAIKKAVKLSAYAIRIY